MIDKISSRIKKNKSLAIILLVVLVLIVLLIVALFTRAYLLNKEVVPRDAVINVSVCGDAIINSSGAFTFENAYPMLDTSGLRTEGHNFSVSNTCSSAATLKFYFVITSNDTYFSYVRYSINSNTPGTLKNTSSSYIKNTLSISPYQKLSEKITNQITTALGSSSWTYATLLTTENLAANQKQNYNFKFWLSTSASNSLQSNPSITKNLTGVIVIADE